MKKEKFVIKDILTNKKKLDRRYYLVQRFKQFLAAFVLGSILGALFGCYLADGGSISIGSPQPLGQTIIQEVKADEHDEEYYKAEPLRYLRYRGEQLGINEYTITKIITMITTCENKKLDPEAYNINNDKYRSMDVGIMMINMYWHRHEVKLVDMLDPVKNIDYGYKLFLEQGFEPWACAHKLGYVK